MASAQLTLSEILTGMFFEHDFYFFDIAELQEGFFQQKNNTSTPPFGFIQTTRFWMDFEMVMFNHTISEM